jgi:hypothetical protein
MKIGLVRYILFKWSIRTLLSERASWKLAQIILYTNKKNGLNKTAWTTRDLGSHSESYDLKTGPPSLRTSSHHLKTGLIRHSDIWIHNKVKIWIPDTKSDGIQLQIFFSLVIEWPLTIGKPGRFYKPRLFLFKLFIYQIKLSKLEPAWVSHPSLYLAGPRCATHPFGLD